MTLLAACAKENASAPAANNETPAAVNTTAKNKDVVQWPELRALDELAELAEAFCDKKNAAGMRRLAPRINQAALRVAQGTPPANATRLDEVKMLQKDLS